MHITPFLPSLNSTIPPNLVVILINDPKWVKWRKKQILKNLMHRNQ